MDEDDAFVMSFPPLRNLDARTCTEAFVFGAWTVLSKPIPKENIEPGTSLRVRLEHLKEQFQYALASTSDSHDRAVSSDGCVGIIDTGASKSVIGQNRVRSLVESLPEATRSRVARRPSDTVFRFGNNGTLKSVEAVYLPFGKRWMKVEVVSGSTPFLISNAFLYALEATLDVARSELVIPGWSRSFRLHRNGKGLLTVNLLEVIAEADKKDMDKTSKSQEIISMASSFEDSKRGDVPDMHEVGETHMKVTTKEQQQPTAARTAQSTSSNRQSSTSSSLSVSQHGGVRPQDGKSRRGPGDLGCSNSESSMGCPTAGRGGSRDGCAEAQGDGRTSGSSSRDSLSTGMGRDGIPRRQACPQDVSMGVRARPTVHQLHDQEHPSQDCVDQELSGVLSSSDASRDVVRIPRGIKPFSKTSARLGSC